MRPEALWPGEAGQQECLGWDVTEFLGSSLKEKSSVLFLTSLHPVTVDVKRTRVHQLANEPIFIGDVPYTGQGEGLGCALGENLLKGMATPHTVHCTLC